MKTEFLKGFGLSDEDIQKILAENGRDVEREKAKTDAANEEIKTLKNVILVESVVQNELKIRLVVDKINK